MQSYAIQNKLTPFISMQNHYSLAYREEEREMFPTLKQYGVGAIPWSPLARGRLTRPLTQQTKRGEVDRFIGQYSKSQASADAIVNRVEELAGKKGCSMAQLALAWIMNRPGVTAPIVGTTSLENLADLIGECGLILWAGRVGSKGGRVLTGFVGAVDVKLSEEDMKYLEEPYIPQGVIGHQ